ncbi:pectin acetylesterase-family hydrolase [Nannocystis pusilla]|uniref:pectin acetylesterase-family hydrolase n=1 Tax=Nannocystis pusilla TaxID=889268 RepID=UPI003B7630C5
MCRDGSTTGIGVRYGAGDNLVIYFEGGGACFNSDTCALNELWKNFGEFKFDAWALGIGQGGIFDDDPQNPVRDWSFIYVPYCTGDVHAGDRENVGIDGVLGAQQFVGYRNVAAYLERIVPTFEDAGHVLVTGSSAGGFGAALNYDRIAGAFPGSAVTLLDDSGPPMSDQYMPVCMQQLWRDLFNFDATLPADCADCFGADGGDLQPRHLPRREVERPAPGPVLERAGRRDPHLLRLRPRGLQRRQLHRRGLRGRPVRAARRDPRRGHRVGQLLRPRHRPHDPLEPQLLLDRGRRRAVDRVDRGAPGRRSQPRQPLTIIGSGRGSLAPPSRMHTLAIA